MWTQQVAIADLPVTFTDPTDLITRGAPATWVQALSPGGAVVLVLDGGLEEEVTLSAGQTLRGSYVGVDASDCDFIAGTGDAPTLAGGAAGSTGATGATGPTGATGAAGAPGSATAYTPAVGGNYSPAVTTIAAALDQLAARVVILETP